MRIPEIMMQKINVFFAILDMVLADIKPIFWSLIMLMMVANLSPYLWGPMLAVCAGMYKVRLATEFRHKLESAALELRSEELRQKEHQLRERQGAIIQDLLEENNRKTEIILRLAGRLSENENPRDNGGEGQQAPAA